VDKKQGREWKLGMEEAEELARTWEQGEVDGDEEGEGQPTHPPTSSTADGRPPVRWVGGFSLALARSRVEPSQT
jgi:hypothetical protein